MLIKIISFYYSYLFYCCISFVSFGQFSHLFTFNKLFMYLSNLVYEIKHYLQEKSDKTMVMPIWIPDKCVTMCQLCTVAFSLTYRRHHCRICGKVYIYMILFMLYKSHWNSKYKIN